MAANIYVMLYFPNISLGSPPISLVGPFKTGTAAAVFGHDWQESRGDNPCWQTIEIEGAPSDVLVEIAQPEAARVALGLARKMNIDLTVASADELLRLNEWQIAGEFHPFTCPNRGDGRHRAFNGDLGALVATTRGWICPWCEYTQVWAHSFMVRG